ncbi:MAG: ArsR/SmtB family transcription factor [Ilumatobacteraceae bacterium]
MDTHVVGDADDAHVDEAVRVLKLLADPTRLRVVKALLHGEHSVGELAEHVGSRQAAVSQHLAKLRWAGLVTSRRDGNRIYYRTVDDHVERLVAEAFSHALHVRPVTTPTAARRA